MRSLLCEFVLEITTYKPVDGKTFLYREHENTRAVPTFESNKEQVILGGHRYVNSFLVRREGDEG